MQQGFLSAGLILAWLVTPESLRLVGSSSGMSGLLNIVCLGFGLIISLASAFQIHSPKIVNAGYSSDYKCLSHAYGEISGFTVLLSGRIPFLLFASTGMLVTAGFAFSEIFLYWFPNFLFAFILLVLVAVLNMTKSILIFRSQCLFVCLTVAGLAALIVLGATTESPVSVNYTGQQNGLSAPLFAVGCVSFLGFDFHKSEQGRGIVMVSLFGGFLLLALWTVTALKFTSSEILAESTIAHMIVARAIAGESGRYIMGSVIIFGVLSGVNGLFIVVRKVFADLKEVRGIPHKINQNWFVITVISVTIGLMMLTGFAGEQILEVRIKASIILWLFYLSLRNYSVCYLLRSEGGAENYLGYLTGSVYLLAGAILAATSSQVIYIFWFILAIMIGTGLLSLTWFTIYNKKWSQKPILRRM